MLWSFAILCCERDTASHLRDSINLHHYFSLLKEYELLKLLKLLKGKRHSFPSSVLLTEQCLQQPDARHQQRPLTNTKLLIECTFHLHCHHCMVNSWNLIHVASDLEIFLFGSTIWLEPWLFFDINRIFITTTLSIGFTWNIFPTFIDMIRNMILN